MVPTRSLAGGRQRRWKIQTALLGKITPVSTPSAGWSWSRATCSSSTPPTGSFADSDQGGVHWGVIASLIETCKLNVVDPQAYLADVLSRLVNRHPASQIDQLMPWAYADPAA
jgi:hypothetical protein